MGVPKFFRYISERYPCLSELVREQNIAEFDNLYLDMNGIIHNCSHPDDGNVHFRITETDMLKDIFNYIEKLFFIIKPQKLLFMAIDGVAPRAKMNQQRSRRFRTAKEAEILKKNATTRGEKLPDDAAFDSNCITPGTEFMERLHLALKYFIKNKISNDPLWKNCRVILSGHDSPGEGEHKIMDYIRFLKAQADYDTNTRHCLYGLDADLIILGLCTHESHFSLLREEVKFGKKSKKVSQEDTRFYLLHLGLLREYLELEFNELKVHEHFDTNKLMDDWILMGLLVGNDFIPHIPNLHINSNALPILYKAYMKVWPELGGNINENGELNLERLEKFFKELAECEFEMFKENYADLKYFEAKVSANGIEEAFDIDIEEVKNSNADLDDLVKLIQESEMMMINDNDENEDIEDEESYITAEFYTYKRNYYIKKLKYDEMTPDVLIEQTKCYVTALQWILYYYYKGVQSWGWYFPHHYAPFVSDLKNFKDFKIEFNIGKPFLPFQQLLAVLPPASKDHLPEAFWNLMTDEDSAVINYYPNDFETDLNGKKQEWEAVVLIPFIEEKTLINAMEPCLKDLTSSEVQRNTHGPMVQYDFSDVDQGECPGIYSFSPLLKVFCTEKMVWRDNVLISNEELLATQCKKSKSNIFVPGFPTMKFLQYKGELRGARVRVFDQPCRNESMILIPDLREEVQDVNIVATKYLYKTVYIGWPHLTKARVVAVSNIKQHIDANGVRPVDERLYNLHVRTIKDHLMTRMGIDLQDLSVILHVQILIGAKYTYSTYGRFTLTETWSSTDMAYPAQGLVSDIEVHSPNCRPQKKIEEIFPVNSTIFFIGNPYYGSVGKVLDPLLVYECGRLKVSITALPEPDLSEARIVQKEHASEYYDTQQVKGFTGLNYGYITRITGSVFVIPGMRRSDFPENTRKVNIGLQLKFPKNQEQVAGYMRKERNTWLYSQKAVNLLIAYYEKYPKIFELLSRNSNSSDIYFETDIFTEIEGENSAEGIRKWIKSQDFNQCDHVPIGSSSLEKEAVISVLEATEKIKTLPVKNIKLQVKPHLLLNSELWPASIKPKKFRLFDRVVIVKSTYGVPMGLRGTIIAIHPFVDLNPVRLENVKAVDNSYQVLFDVDLPSGKGVYGVAEGRIAKVAEEAMLLIFAQDSKESSNINTAINHTDKSNVRCTNYSSNDNKIEAQFECNKPPVTILRGDSNFWLPSSNVKPNNPVTIDDHSTKAIDLTKLPTPNTISLLPNVETIEQPITKLDRKVEKEYVQKQSVDNTPEGFLNNFITSANRKSIGESDVVKKQQDSSAPVYRQTSREFYNSADALKNLLQIADSLKEQPRLENKTQMKGSFPQPPKPPSNWRNDALKSTDVRRPNPSDLSFCGNAATNHPKSRSNFFEQPSYSNIHHANASNVPLQFYGQNISQLGPQQQMPYVNDNFYSPVSLNQKGAFIPLQVLRGGTKSSKQDTNRAEKKNSPNSRQQLNSLAQVQVNESPQKQQSKEVEDKQTTKKRPRVPKLAAKFDYV